jgi:hypothetical protein
MGDYKESVSENDFFITIVQIIKENGETGQLIRKILFMEQDTRCLFIDHFISDLKRDKNDENLIEAISFLKRSDIVNEIIKMLG